MIEEILGTERVTADQILAIIHQVRLPEWEDNLRRWIAVTATGRDGRVPDDNEIRSWLADELVATRVACLVRRIPKSWLKEV